MKKSVAFVILVIAFGAAACSSISNLMPKSETNSNSASTNSNSTSAPGNNPVTAGVNSRDELINASKKFTGTNSFRATMDGKGSKDMHIELDYIAPDRYYLKNAPTMETIIIGKDTYMKSGDSWRKFPVSLGDAIPKMRDAFTEEGMKSLTDVEYVGEETVNGKSAFLYRYKGDTVKEATKYNAKIWIGKDNGLPLKIEVEYPDGTLLKNMTTVYDYDTKLTIEAPSAK
jgi:outer membrane lipoprotein-sorting protein